MVKSVDGEIKKILSESYERAKAILRAHTKEHKALAEALLKYETLDADDIKAIMSGESIKLDRPRGKEAPSPAPATTAATPLLPTQPNPA
ncbi:hypothetical protein evm_001666 [Chilo suppressalis]|nr:hypothetical protein evm_001666 [Chilo suppressalis]